MILPSEMTNFKPYGVTCAAIQSGDTIYRAALGSIGDDKSTFHVWVWAERGGVATLVPIEAPPNNAPSFYVASGRVVLCGVLEDNTGRHLVERDIASYIDPVAWAIYNANGGKATGLKQVLQSLTKENLWLKPWVGE